MDIAHKTEERRQKSEVRRKIKDISLGLFSVFCLLSSVLSFSCSLPRIIILDDPLTPEEHINLGVAYEKKNEMDLAIKEYEIASKRLPVAYLYLGNVYMQKGNINEAEKYYRKAIKKQPELADAHNNLAWLYYTKAKGSGLKVEDINEILKEAEGLALKALELNPSNENYKDTLDKIRELESKNGL